MAITERVARLRQQSLDAVPTLSIERAELLTAFYGRDLGPVSAPVRRALAFRYLMEHKAICINPGELIVGEKGPAPKAAPTYPELCCHTLDDLELLDGREKIPFKVSQEARQAYAETILPFWRGKTMREAIFREMTAAWKDAYEAGIFTEFMEQRGPGHTTLDDKIYRRGMLDFAADIEAQLARLDYLNDPTAYDRQEQLKAMHIAAHAIVRFALRHAERARTLAEGEPNPARKAELLQIESLSGRRLPHSITLDVRRGKILGIAGLVLTFGAQMLWYPVGWTAGYLVLLVLVGMVVGVRAIVDACGLVVCVPRFDLLAACRYLWIVAGPVAADQVDGRARAIAGDEVTAVAGVFDGRYNRPRYAQPLPAEAHEDWLQDGHDLVFDEDAQQLVHSPARFIEEAQAAWQRKAQDLFEKLPTLHAQDKRLEAFYNRSLLHLLLNQWRVPEFKLQPYYSTGSMIGGCACSYLWDFGNNHHVFSLYDPAAQREHIKAFLSIDLTKHFAFLPITGQAYGPWYYINQEKIIFHIYHYVLNTGDVRFLFEKVNGKTIVDHVVEQALVGDDLSKDAVLVDYGDGNHHLELRREYRYDHVLPDMNGRRYAYYLAADELCRMAGKATVNLRNRAEAIKRLLRRTLWSPKHNWFFWLDAKGKKHLRYTVQMFKLIGSPVLDADQERGLLSHLNEDEFLSDYGLHSMSKKDPAYDQVDIDNGGGGCCSCFIGPIVKKLYRAGRPDRAEDILRRVLWWGDRLPYWSDSLVANRKDYRRDTPLQNAIGSVSAAQGIMFGMFGLNVDVDGRITVNPRPPRFSPRIALHGLRLRGRRMDLLVNGNSFTVRADDRTVRSALGRPVILERL